MSASLELALKKQRLLMDAERLRGDFTRHAQGLAPAFHGADLALDGLRWLYRRPYLVLGVTIALVAARPVWAWRWARRAFLGWQTWRRVSGLLERRISA